MSASEERWNEPESILLLQRAAKLVAGIEATGVRMAQGDQASYATLAWSRRTTLGI
ncbi:MAG: hypothetical protein LC781_01395 [Actinobacteria bacterium]|nr:hypothetical protein [Actinomycetota bacterium]